MKGKPKVTVLRSNELLLTRLESAYWLKEEVHSILGIMALHDYNDITGYIEIEGMRRCLFLRSE